MCGFAATEAYDDDGLPHTLEHLIFLGSEQYPYKGVLDLLANRCLASGTNAWTGRLPQLRTKIWVSISIDPMFVKLYVKLDLL